MHVFRNRRLRNAGRWWMGAIVIVLVPNSAVGVLSDPLPIDLFYAVAQSQGGWDKDALAIQRGGYGRHLFGGWTYLEVRTEDEPAQMVYIKMTRPVHLVPWRVVEYRASKPT
jgi:hypothetical protein